jgi:hypothetical protein
MYVQHHTLPPSFQSSPIVLDCLQPNYVPPPPSFFQKVFPCLRPVWTALHAAFVLPLSCLLVTQPPLPQFDQRAFDTLAKMKALREATRQASVTYKSSSFNKGSTSDKVTSMSSSSRQASVNHPLASTRSLLQHTISEDQERAFDSLTDPHVQTGEASQADS